MPTSALSEADQQALRAEWADTPYDLPLYTEAPGGDEFDIKQYYQPGQEVPAFVLDGGLDGRGVNLTHFTDEDIAAEAVEAFEGLDEDEDEEMDELMDEAADLEDEVGGMDGGSPGGPPGLRAWSDSTQPHTSAPLASYHALYALAPVGPLFGHLPWQLSRPAQPHPVPKLHLKHSPTSPRPVPHHSRPIPHCTCCCSCPPAFPLRLPLPPAGPCL